MQSRLYELEKGFQTACICSGISSEQIYCPEFLYNDKKEGRMVLSAIEEELQNCEEFFFSTAFITKGGAELLKPAFWETEKRNLKGRILTTDYQGISELGALKELAKMKNIELRVYRAKENKTGFHTKGYIFKKEGLYRIIMGSSNMTTPALTTNKEWNLRFVTTPQGKIVKNMLHEYEKMWKKSIPL
ncbi:MAG: phospholipase D-like domain-containing protein [Lachnospiraceae bacterium]